MKKVELIDLILDAVCDLGRTECDCGRQLNPADWVSREDVEKWLTKKRIDILGDELLENMHSLWKAQQSLCADRD